MSWARPQIRVRTVETASEFEALGPRWEALQAEARLTSVFETFDWQYLWWKSYGRGQPLRVLIATEGDKLIGILPTYIQTQSLFHYPVRALRFVGSGGDTSPDDLDPILAPDREVEVAEALVDALLRMQGFDVLLLADMNPKCAFAKVLADRARSAGLETLTGTSEQISFIDLPATWDAWLQSLHGDRRYRVKKIRKKLQAAHPARFFVWDDPATVDQGIDRLIHLHHKRWNSISQEHAFSSPSYIQFHRALMKACLDRDRLRLYALELSGQVVAMYYFYRFRNIVYLMQSGFDPDFSTVKPGQVLLGHIIEHAITEGNTGLDFLRGDHRYKDELASGTRETVFVTALRQSPGAWVYRARRMYAPVIKARVMDVLKRIRPPAAPVPAAAPDPATQSSPTPSTPSE